MITVYIRDEPEEEGVLLGQFWPEDIAKLPELFKQFTTDIKGSDGLAHFIASGFVCDHAGVYFEIIVDRG